MNWTRIKDTRYNRYLTPGTLPKYLRERRRNGEHRILARARCGSTDNVWAKEAERECTLCEEEKGTFEHWRKCRELGETDLNMERILTEEGDAEAVVWLRKIEKEKERKRNRKPNIQTQLE